MEEKIAHFLKNFHVSYEIFPDENHEKYAKLLLTSEEIQRIKNEQTQRIKNTELIDNIIQIEMGVMIDMKNLHKYDEAMTATMNRNREITHFLYADTEEVAQKIAS